MAGSWKLRAVCCRCTQMFLPSVAFRCAEVELARCWERYDHKSHDAPTYEIRSRRSLAARTSDPCLPSAPRRPSTLANSTRKLLQSLSRASLETCGADLRARDPLLGAGRQANMRQRKRNASKGKKQCRRWTCAMKVILLSRSHGSQIGKNRPSECKSRQTFQARCSAPPASKGPNINENRAKKLCTLVLFFR